MSKPTVLVTGAANGIGCGTAEILSQRGWRVAVNDLDPDAVATVAQELGGIAVPGDVARDTATIVARTLESTGRLDGLINNAGIVRPQSLADITPENIDETIAVNLRAAMLLSAAALPHLESRAGAIVNIASFTVNHPVPHGGTYSASKGALLTYTRQAAVEWGSARRPGQRDRPRHDPHGDGGKRLPRSGEIQSAPPARAAGTNRHARGCRARRRLPAVRGRALCLRAVHHGRRRPVVDPCGPHSVRRLTGNQQGGAAPAIRSRQAWREAAIAAISIPSMSFSGDTAAGLRARTR